MPKESLEQKKKRALKILQKLKKAYPGYGLPLKYKTPMQLLSAVILSAQSTDQQVNKLTDDLFKKYKTVNDFATTNLKTFTSQVAQVAFYKNKAKYIINAAKKIKKDYNGRIPNDINELVKLPGVARKTANVVQYQLYGKAEGIPVDTHVIRIANKLGLTNEKDPVKIERDLMELYPPKYWGEVSYYLQAYGRKASPARGKPKEGDPLKGLY